MIVGSRIDVEDAIPSELRRLIGGHAGCKTAVLGWETRLVHDLGIMGDSFYELLEDVSFLYGTEFTHVCWTAHAPSEAELLNIWPGKKRILAACKPMTLKQLHDAIRAGGWVTDASEPERRIVDPRLIFFATRLGPLAVPLLAWIFVLLTR